MGYAPFPEIVGPTYTLSSLNAECQRCVNLQIEEIESGAGQNEFYLKETPGLRLLKDYSAQLTGTALFDFAYVPIPYGSSAVIADIFVSGKLDGLGRPRVFMALGPDILEVESDGTATFLKKIFDPFGSLAQRTSGGKFCENQTGLFFFSTNLLDLTIGGPESGLWMYRWADGNTHYADAALAGYLGRPFGSESIVFLNQRILVINSAFGAGRSLSYQISPLNADSLTAWNAAEIYKAEASVDPIVAIAKLGSQLWVFGSSTYEVHIDTGGENLNVFARIQDAVFPIGLLNNGSLNELNGHLFWLGNSAVGTATIYMSNGLQPQRVSTLAIECIIQENLAVYVTLTSISSWTYTLEGHSVYVINVGDVTLAYDMSVDAWHELSYRDPVTVVFGRHRGDKSAIVNGQVLVTDYASPKLYELRTDVYTDNLAPIIRYRRAPVVATGNRDIFFKKLQFNMQVGVGLLAQPDPLIYIRWSDDNGNTWGTYHDRTIGALGKYKERVIFNRLGVSNRRVFEVYFDDPVPFRIISAELLLEIGLH